MARTVLYVLLAAAVALAGWGVARLVAGERPAAAPAAASATAPLPVDAVLLVRPAVPSRAPPTTAAPVAPQAVSPELAQFRARRDYASLYRALEGAPATAETLYLRAELYFACARPPGKSSDDVARERAARREQLVAGLAQGVATAAQRIDAFDRLDVDACAGLDLGTFDPEVLARMVAAAADAGDRRARAWQLADRVERSWQGTQAAGQPSGYDWTEADFEQARRLLASNDPEVIADLQGILSSSIAHGSIRLGNQPIDQRAFHTALTMLACDAGASCGADAPTLLRNCAVRGRCAAGSLYEYFYYYENSPADAQLIDSYRRTLQAMINGGDLSALAYSPLPGTPGFTMMFGGRRTRPGG